MTRKPIHTDATTPRQQGGLSLVELLVALFIGLLLLAAVVQVFSGSLRTSQFQQALSRVQETGRYAVSRLREDLRMTGYQGCGGPNMNITDHRQGNDEDFNAQFVNGMQGFVVDADGNIENDDDDANATAVNKPPLDNQAVVNTINPNNGTEGLLISGVRRTNVVFNNSNPPALQLQNNNRGPFQQCDVVFLEDRDCGFVRVFVVGANNNAAVINTNGTGGCTAGNENMNPNQLSNPWPNIQGARALRAQRVLYYIRDDNDGEPSLFRWTGNGQGTAGNAQQLVSGVEQMHVAYGVSTGPPDDAINQYVPLGQVTNWGNVLAARVSLLVRSRADNVTDSPQEVAFPPGATMTPADNRLRQVFTTTVAFRNRLP